MMNWIVEEDEDWKGGAFCKCPYCGYAFALGAYHEPYEWLFCPMCGNRVGEEEKQARLYGA